MSFRERRRQAPHAVPLIGAALLLVNMPRFLTENELEGLKKTCLGINWKTIINFFSVIFLVLSRNWDIFT